MEEYKVVPSTWKTVLTVLKVKHTPTIQLSSSILGHLSKRNESLSICLREMKEGLGAGGEGDNRG